MSTDAPSPPEGTAPPAAPPEPPAAPPEQPPADTAAAQPQTPPAPEATNANLLVIKDKVQRYLTDLVGSVEVTSDGSYTFQTGSARVFIRCFPWSGTESTIVSVGCAILFGCAATPELFEHIATHADDYLFGHLSAERLQDGTINVLFTHSLLGDFLDPEELKSTVGAVVTTADQLDDELKTRFGGKRFHDDVA